MSGELLSRDAILGAQDLGLEEVFIPEWGGPVLVRGLSGMERDEYEISGIKAKGTNVERDWRNFRARLVVRCVVDREGKRVFVDEDAERLGAKSGAALDRVFAVASRLSGLSKEDLDELEKNFGRGQPGS